MASVELTEAWIHLGSDLSVFVSHPLREIRETSTSQTQVRTYAGGVQRLITGPARPQTFEVSLVRVPAAMVDVLRGWRGTLLLLRDVRGRTIWGAYQSLQIADWRGEDSHDVAFTFQTVTHSIEV